MLRPLPAYAQLVASGELACRAEALWALLAECTVCPSACRVDRLGGERGRCKVGARPPVGAYVAHFGEEPCLSGTRGAGNVFFGSCNMRCAFCQNHQISQDYARIARTEVSLERLADIYLELQDQGCHVLGWVSPSHVVPHAVGALVLAAERGLRLPLVYNTNGYDALQTLRLLDGVVDIYLPDLKYGDSRTAVEISSVQHYWESATAALVEMYRQVGPLRLDDDGIARRGMIIRHLVMPNDMADSERCLRWVRETLGPEVTLSLMAQYYPAHRAAELSLISRKTSLREYERVVELALDLGFENLFVQDHADAADTYRPDFDRQHAFHHGPLEDFQGGLI